jgi:hypothetical protein
MSTLTDDQPRDILSTFQTEAADHLQALNQTLFQLERMVLASDEQTALVGLEADHLLPHSEDLTAGMLRDLIRHRLQKIPEARHVRL